MRYRLRFLTLILLGVLFVATWGFLAGEFGKYQAPHPNAGLPPEKVIPKRYIIYLAPGHSLQQHSMAINCDIVPYIERVLTLHDGKIVYVGRQIEQGLLSSIRADPKVELVYSDPKIFTDGS